MAFVQRAHRRDKSPSDAVGDAAGRRCGDLLHHLIVWIDFHHCRYCEQELLAIAQARHALAWAARSR